MTHIGPLFSLVYWSRLWSKQGEKIIASAAEIAVIIAAYFVIRFVLLRLVFRLTGTLLSRVSGELVQARESRLWALKSILGSAVMFVLGFVAVIMVLQAAGFNIVPLLTTASVAGLAVGFGAQKLVRDVIAGIFILVEDQYGVGDYVTIGATSGTVEELGMRITRIRDSAGRLCIISNGDISQVCNHSRGHCLFVQDVAVAATADLQKAREVLDQIGEAIAREMPAAVLEAPRSVGIAQMSAASVTVRLQGSVLALRQDEVRVALNTRIQEQFKAAELALA